MGSFIAPRAASSRTQRGRNMDQESEAASRLEQENGSLKENLEKAAYYNWLDRGCPLNDGLCDWVKMEKDLVGKFE